MTGKRGAMVIGLILALALVVFGCTGPVTGTKATGGGWIPSYNNPDPEYGNGKANFGFNAQILAEINGLDAVQQTGFYLAKGQLQFVDHSFNLLDFLPCFLGPDDGYGLSNGPFYELNVHGIVLAAKIEGPNGLDYPAGLAFGVYYVQVPYMVDSMVVGEIPFMIDSVIPVGFFLVKVQDKGEPGAVDQGDWFKIWLTPAEEVLSSMPTGAELVSAMQATINAVETNGFCYENGSFLSGGNIQVKIGEDGGMEPETSASVTGKGKRK